MLIHPWDAGTDEQSLAYVKDNQFGHLIAAGRGREVPVVVPTQFLLVDDRTIVLHLARPNPVWAAIGENPKVVMSVAGPWSYIPGQWRAEPGVEPELGVPTTYYSSVQLICQAEIVTEVEGKLEILREQLDDLEPGHGDPGRMPRLMSGIQGIRLAIEEIRGKFKYDGHKDAAHRERVAKGLTERAGPGDSSALSHL
ncbi:FMN-binding negative transcriptional regulator [Nonomuraea sp. NEAU-A123]|uniref:FMN-binding negative transcriptional regulator n=1 Tax=Nonomuraea sp. NEAU-A123 TaxID=2839649 RepID=UPI001BE47F4F|nr:FMN-binding negative transcriptional regulator [Nonomuraea sp. NEAU-A123]MBT2232894.1 FMN-binding negative transcriptional regulator [Nonomuraea sp. NEAU-A123]